MIEMILFLAASAYGIFHTILHLFGPAGLVLLVVGILWLMRRIS